MSSETNTKLIENLGYDRKIKLIYLIGAICGIIAVFIIRRNLGAEYHLLKSIGLFKNAPGSIPTKPVEWFILLNTNTFVGLLLLEFFDVINVLLVSLLTLSLYFVLKNYKKGLMVLSLLFCIFSTLLYISNDISFSMFALSKQYSVKISDEELNHLISAGYALLSKYDPNTIYGNISSYFKLFFLYLSGLLASIAMINSKIFKRISAIMGIIANSIGLLYFILIFINQKLLFIPISFAAPFTIIWYAIIAFKMIKIFREKI